MREERPASKILKRYISQMVVSQIFVSAFVYETVMDCTVEWGDGTIERVRETSRHRNEFTLSGLIRILELGLPKIEPWKRGE